MNGKKVLITGASGYLGAQISQYLAKNGYCVSGLCFPEIPNDENWQKNFDSLFVCDIRDTAKLRTIAENQFDVLIHLVSLDHHQSSNAPDFVTSINITPTWNLLDIFCKKGLKKFLFFSTIHVYGKNISGTINEDYLVNPASPYALTHFLSENICRYYAANSDIDCVIGRLSNSYGQPVFAENNCWWLVVNDLCKVAFYEKKIVLQSDGSPLRDFINGKDVCQAVKTLIDKGENGKIYHISSGETFSILELAQKVQTVYEKRFGVKLDITTKPSNDQAVAKYTINNYELKKLGFHPEFSLETGIKILFDYLEYHH